MRSDALADDEEGADSLESDSIDSLGDAISSSSDSPFKCTRPACLLDDTSTLTLKISDIAAFSHARVKAAAVTPEPAVYPTNNASGRGDRKLA